MTEVRFRLYRDGNVIAEESVECDEQPSIDWIERQAVPIFEQYGGGRISVMIKDDDGCFTFHFVEPLTE